MAETFSEFVDKLRPIEVEYCLIEWLVRHGQEGDLDEYLASGAAIAALGKKGHSLLCEAIKFGNDHVVNACLERQAFLSRALHFATHAKRVDLIIRLVKLRADVNEADEHEMKPLECIGGTFQKQPTTCGLGDSHDRMGRRRWGARNATLRYSANSHISSSRYYMYIGCHRCLRQLYYNFAQATSNFLFATVTKVLTASSIGSHQLPMRSKAPVRQELETHTCH